jgi:hypothetical protein
LQHLFLNCIKPSVKEKTLGLRSSSVEVSIVFHTDGTITHAKDSITAKKTKKYARIKILLTQSTSS